MRNDYSVLDCLTEGRVHVESVEKLITREIFHEIRDTMIVLPYWYTR